ncbi:MAG: metal ABC transporter ATP-binding protein [Peptostreptococcaceae bacterium]|nr:metal ABC transporter ATP-binding protein [Peptostreptococcaceae bacterium]
MNEKAIEVKNLSFSYGKGEERVISDVSFEVYRGDYFGLIGPNGSGKTTLLKLCLGLIKRKSGLIRVLGEDINELKNRKRIAYISQKANSFNTAFPATAEEIILSGLLALGYGKQKAKEAMRETMHRLKIENLGKKKIGELSGGQQQRVFIAKAVASQPEILFLDEPTVGIDYQAEEYFYATMEKLNESGMTIFMINHDISSVTACAKRVGCIGETFHVHDAEDMRRFADSKQNIFGSERVLITH